MKVRISTTVDDEVLGAARSLGLHATDASLVEAALVEYLRAHRRAEVDRAYAEGYGQAPLDTTDAWGDLQSWHGAVSRP